MARHLLFAAMILIATPAAFAQITDLILEADNTQACGASATVTPAIGDPAPGIQLSKPCPTATNAFADVNIISPLENGTTPVSTITSAGFDIQNNTHCGAGAPRFEIALDNNAEFVTALGCQAGNPVDLGNGFSHVTFTAPQIAAAVLAAGGTPASTISQIFILFDEGNDTPVNPPLIGTPGTAVIDNIMLNGVTIAAGGTADLAITKVASTTTPTAGTPFTFTLTATNNGPSSATNVMVTDVLPAGLTFGSTTTTQGTCTGSTTVTCTVGGLATGASATIVLTVTAPAAGAQSNTATVTANELDPTPANNTATATVTTAPVVPPPPPPTTIPTLSEWALLALAGALAAFGTLRMKL
jgi:uncharacterized repeat protein (TIGR01451 family)